MRFVKRVWSAFTRLVPLRVRNPVAWGSFKRDQPFSRTFGSDRGLEICRFYIDEFLAEHSRDIQGRVLEIGDPRYTHRFGGSRVTESHVLHVSEGYPGATIIADLTKGNGLESDSFDCIILTQTLSFIFDVPAAVRTVHRILKPNGVVLATLPGISQVSRYDMDRWGDFWRFTTASGRKSFEVFGDENVAVSSRGNVTTAVGYLAGLASEDVPRAALTRDDPDYQLLITVRAIKQPVDARNSL